MLARFAGQGFGVFKPALADLMVASLAPITERYRALIADPAHLDAVLAGGAARARAISGPILAQAYAAVGF